jgi:hypothetical protein
MKLSYFPFALAVVSTLVTPSAAWTDYFAELDGVAYRFRHLGAGMEKNWAIAKADAEYEVCGVEGILAMPKTQLEHDTLHDLRSQLQGSKPFIQGWLGATQTFNENKKDNENQEPGLQWKWLDGTHVMVPHGNNDGGKDDNNNKFVMWRQDEPNDGRVPDRVHRSEGCLMLYEGSQTGFYFNDRKCDKALVGYFAQYKLPTFKMGGSCDTGVPVLFDTVDGQCNDNTEFIEAACDTCSDGETNFVKCVKNELDEYSYSPTQIAKITTCCKEIGGRKRYLRGE